MSLTPEIREFLSQPRFAVLGTLNADGSVQQTVMWYLLQGDSILMNTNTARTKFRNLNSNPRVSVCVSDGYTYVTLQGDATLDQDRKTSQADIARIAHHYVSHQEFEKTYRKGFEDADRVSIRIPIDRVINHGV